MNITYYMIIKYKGGDEMSKVCDSSTLSALDSLTNDLKVVSFAYRLYVDTICDDRSKDNLSELFALLSLNMENLEYLSSQFDRLRNCLYSEITMTYDSKF